jgi:hypothetical protein
VIDCFIPFSLIERLVNQFRIIIMFMIDRRQVFTRLDSNLS